MTKSPEFTVWQMMIQRCCNPSTVSYASYGARGITICKRWRDSFEAFYADMGDRPSPEHTLERVDNAKGYSPDNCRWASSLEQGQNKRNNHLLTFKDQTLTLQEWSRRLDIPKSTLLNRLKYGWSTEEALSMPRRRRAKL
jgi:hypothetical protein